MLKKAITYASYHQADYQRFADYYRLKFYHPDAIVALPIGGCRIHTPHRAGCIQFSMIRNRAAQWLPGFVQRIRSMIFTFYFGYEAV